MEELAGSSSTGDELIIALSKGRLSLIALGAIAFVVLCAWVVTADDVSIVRRALAGIGIPFFGLCALWGLRKLFDTRPGLILSSNGFVDNASALAAGFVPWTDVTGTHVVEIKRQRILMVTVKNPEHYIARGGPVTRLLNRGNMRMAGSPIAISANSLKIGFDELLAAFDANRSRFG